ncbi:MAG: diguanylate cyclase [bacterium]
MRYDFLLATILIAAATFLIVGAIYALIRKERLLGLKLLGVFAIINAIYSIAYAGYLLTDSEAHIIDFIRIQNITVPFLIPLWFIISVQQRYEQKRFTWRMVHIVFAIPLIAAITALLYPRGNIVDPSWIRTLFYTDHYVDTILLPGWEGFVGIHFTKGVVYYILVGYTLVVAILAAFNFFIMMKRGTGIVKKRSRLLFVTALITIPLIALMLIWRESRLIDLTAIYADWVVFAVFLALFKYEMFDLIPAAYAEIFRKSDYPIVILDETKYIVMMNAAAERAFCNRPADDVNKLTLAQLHENGEYVARELTAGRECEVEIDCKGKHQFYRANLSKLGKAKKKPTGFFATYIDITSHKDEMRRMEQMAAYDELTKIYNRRYFFRLAMKAFDDAVVLRQNVRIVMFDLDGFKDINDIYGHQAGDTVLAQLAKLVTQELNTDDIFARYGGEEFIIFQKDITESVARELDKRICSVVAGHAFLYQRRNIKITGSFGVAGSRGGVNKPLERYIKEADDALYVAKQAGKNQVSYAPDLR